MKKPMMLVLVLCLFLFPAANALALDAPGAGFVDVPAGHWALSALTALHERGVLQGYESRMRPEDSITRVEFFAVINRAFAFTETTGAKEFEDVDYAQSDWKTQAVAVASAQGYLAGVGRLALPDEPITREQAFVILGRVLEQTPLEQATSFSDDRQISDWARGYIYAMWKSGYIQGSGNRLYPAADISRAECARLICNVLGLAPAAAAGPVIGATLYGTFEPVSAVLQPGAEPVWVFDLSDKTIYTNGDAISGIYIKTAADTVFRVDGIGSAATNTMFSFQDLLSVLDMEGPEQITFGRLRAVAGGSAAAGGSVTVSGKVDGKPVSFLFRLGTTDAAYYQYSVQQDTVTAKLLSGFGGVSVARFGQAPDSNPVEVALYRYLRDRTGALHVTVEKAGSNSLYEASYPSSEALCRDFSLETAVRALGNEYRTLDDLTGLRIRVSDAAGETLIILVFE